MGTGSPAKWANVRFGSTRVGIKGAVGGWAEAVGGSGWTALVGRTALGRPNGRADSQVPPGPRGEPRKTAKVRPEKRGGVPGVRPPCSRGCLCRLRRGCLRVGTRVRMESRVVGSAGFLPGTPAGAQGSPGARGEPGNMALLPSALRTFFCIRTQKDT